MCSAEVLSFFFITAVPRESLYDDRKSVFNAAFNVTEFPAPSTDTTSGVVREIVPVVTAHQSFYDDGVVVVRVLPLHCLLSV